MVWFKYDWNEIVQSTDNLMEKSIFKYYYIDIM